MSKFISLLALLAISSPALADNHQMAEKAVKALPTMEATLHDAEKNSLGTITLTEAPQGILVATDLQNIPEGWHGFHIHAKGDCSEAGFKSAGGHANHDHGSEGHGFLTQAGPHAGDMPNIWAHADGTSKGHIFLPNQKFVDFMDDNGAAIILHKNADDYKSQPSGAAGPRIGCAVLK